MKRRNKIGKTVKILRCGGWLFNPKAYNHQKLLFKISSIKIDKYAAIEFEY